MTAANITNDANIPEDAFEKIGIDHTDPSKANVDIDNIHRNFAKLADATDAIVAASGQAFYMWTIADDKVEWSRNFTALVGLDESETLHLTGRGFESMLSAQSKETRFGIIMSASRPEVEAGDQPVPYQCVYLLNAWASHTGIDTNPPERNSIWIEDTGHWFAGADGRPHRAEGCIRVINDRRQREEELRRQSDFDDMTGLPNRRTLERLIEKTILESGREGKVSTFMMLSLERFDLINDIYGFDIGDIVLRKVGELIRTKLRADDIICRFSGAKFGLILKDCPPAEIYDAGERLLKAIAREVIKTELGHVAVKGIIGACFIPINAKTVKEAIHGSFQAMRSARNQNTSRVCVFSRTPEDVALAHEKALFSADVVNAVEKRLLQMAYQPVCRSNGDVSFYEALIRMNDPDGKLMIAQNFIKTVEELGLIRLIDRYALEEVLEILKEQPTATVSVNVSQESVLDPDWLTDLAKGLAMIPDKGKRLIIEITESMAVVELDETCRFIKNVKAMGCRVAIDDFGAGFTSFANLKHLDVDMIKIDGSFGISLAANAENQAFVKSLLALAHAFEIETVVEWVEDIDSSNLLSHWAVDYQQGYQFGKADFNPVWPKYLEQQSATSPNE